jgi:hypothetical protein
LRISCPTARVPPNATKKLALPGPMTHGLVALVIPRSPSTLALNHKAPSVKKSLACGIRSSPLGSTIDPSLSRPPLTPPPRPAAGFPIRNGPVL